MQGWASDLVVVLNGLIPFGGWVVLSIGIGFAVLIGLRYYNWRLKHSFQGLAVIRSIKTSSQAEELELEYEFRYRGRQYIGRGSLNPSQLLDKGEPRLYRNAEIELPVLYLDHQAYVGDEAIEHIVLEKRPRLRIRFLSADPSRSFPVPAVITADQHRKA